MPNIEELQLLNYVLIERDWSVVEREGLDSDHFPVQKKVFEYVKDFRKTHGDLPNMDTVLSNFPDFEKVERENLDSVVASLREDLTHRRFRPTLVRAAELMAEKKSIDAIREIRNEANSMLKRFGASTKGYSYVGNADKRKQDYLKIHGRDEDEILGYTTGFKKLDIITNGLEYQEGAVDYFLVFAPSSMGKTLISSFLLQSPWNATPDDDYPAYFALEQRASEIAQNWDNVLAGVSRLAMTRGTMSDEAKDRYVEFLDRIQKKKKDMMIYDLESNGGKPFTINQIAQIIESEGHNRFALDQLSKVALSNSFGHADLRQRLFDVSAETRNMILDLGVPGYVISQANRDSARRAKKSLQDSEVQGEDIGETYAIFQDASKSISSVKLDENTFKLTVVKNRNNKTGDSILVRYNFDTGVVNELNGDLGEQYF